MPLSIYTLGTAKIFCHGLSLEEHHLHAGEYMHQPLLSVIKCPFQPILHFFQGFDVKLFGYFCNQVSDFFHTYSPFLDKCIKLKNMQRESDHAILGLKFA